MRKQCHNFKPSFGKLLIAILILPMLSFGQGPVGAGWTKTFEDNFDGSSIDGTKWNTTWINGGRTVGWSQEYMVDENVTVSNGYLHLRQRFNQANQTGFGGRNESGVITTYGPGKFHQLYGYFEARLKAADGNGNLSAWWMSREESWPPELDIVEILGVKPTEGVLTQHWGTVATDGSHPAESHYWLPGTNLTTTYHVYAAAWNPTEIIWYIDGAEQFRMANNITNQMYLELNIHSGNSWAGYGDAYNGTEHFMDVDYVRVWSNTGSTDTQAPSAPTGLTSSSKTSSSVNLSWSPSTDNVSVAGYDVFNGSTKVNSNTVTATTYNVTGLTANTSYSFTVKAKDAAGNISAASNTYTVTTDVGTTLPGSKLTGTAFGTTPSFSTGTEFSKAFDGSTSTYFDFQNANGAYTGIDVGGAGATVSQIKFYPRSGYESRMNGGKFQGSNTSSSAGFSDIYTITTTPTAAWVTVNVSTPSYRYLRYLAPAGSHGNVAEIEFYGSAGNLPGTFNGDYKIIAKHSGKALDVNGFSTADGAIVQQYSFGGGANQLWNLTSPAAGYYSISNKNSGKVLDVSNNSTTDGAFIHQWTNFSAANQQWSLVDVGGGYYNIKNKNSGKCIDLPGSSTSDGTQITQYACHTGDNQKFQIVNVSAGAREASDKTFTTEATSSVYPNPAKGTITVKFISVKKQSVRVLIANLTNQIVSETIVEAIVGANSVEMNVSQLTSGMHLLTVQNGQRFETHKVIIKN